MRTGAAVSCEQERNQGSAWVNHGSDGRSATHDMGDLGWEYVWMFGFGQPRSRYQRSLACLAGALTACPLIKSHVKAWKSIASVFAPFSVNF